MPYISIIIPVYNSEKYLEKCFNSIKKQTFNDIDIIFINDESTDNSLELLNQFQKNNSNVRIINQPKSGAGAARNKGINSAEGKYILFIDSDDWIDETLCEKLYNNSLLNNPDIVMFDSFFFDDKKQNYTEGGFLNISNWKNHTDENSLHNFNDCRRVFYGNLSCANKMYKLSFLKEDNISFKENFVFEDLIFHIYSLLKAERITIINEKLYTYRRNRPGSMNSALISNDSPLVLQMFEVIDDIDNLIKSDDKYEILKYQFFQFVYESLSNNFVRAPLKIKKEFYTKMQKKFISLQNEDYDFNICKKLTNFFNYSEALKYNRQIYLCIKLILDNPKTRLRYRFNKIIHKF